MWHSESNTGRLEWWQVDLGRPVGIKALEIVFRPDQDQPSTRANFEVRGSNDPRFASSTLLAAQGASAVPFRSLWQAEVKDEQSYRYVRVQKTQPDRDAVGDIYFNLTEVRVYAQRAAPAPARRATFPKSGSARIR
jgi:hypothetical protein